MSTLCHFTAYWSSLTLMRSQLKILLELSFMWWLFFPILLSRFPFGCCFSTFLLLCVFAFILLGLAFSETLRYVDYCFSINLGSSLPLLLQVSFLSLFSNMIVVTSIETGIKIFPFSNHVIMDKSHEIFCLNFLPCKRDELHQLYST